MPAGGGTSGPPPAPAPLSLAPSEDGGLSRVECHPQGPGHRRGHRKLLKGSAPLQLPLWGPPPMAPQALKPGRPDVSATGTLGLEGVCEAEIKVPSLTGPLVCEGKGQPPPGGSLSLRRGGPQAWGPQDHPGAPAPRPLCPPHGAGAPRLLLQSRESSPTPSWWAGWGPRACRGAEGVPDWPEVREASGGVSG